MLMAHTDHALGDVIGRYRLLGEMARGGLGVVYRARQARHDRVLALKMMLTGGLAGESERQRFRTEAESAHTYRDVSRRHARLSYASYCFPAGDTPWRPR